MTLLRSSFSFHALKAAGVATAMLLSASASHAEGPFAGFEGSWSGTGTVALSDGTKERIRCRATYKVGGGGNQLAQTLRCASDSYKFDLTADVASNGDRISGNWSEASRNINGNLQGKAGGGNIEVFVQHFVDHPRQQAVGRDQLQGRHPRRQHQHDQGLIRTTACNLNPPGSNSEGVLFVALCNLSVSVTPLTTFLLTRGRSPALHIQKLHINSHMQFTVAT